MIVVGAGLSGATAATVLAREGHDVLLLERRNLGQAAPRLDWISPHAGRIVQGLGGSADDLRAVPVARCEFYLADWTRSVTPKLPDPPAAIIDYPQAVRRLLELLVAAPAATVCDQAEVVRIHPGENHVRVVLADRSERVGRLLLLTSGSSIALLDDLGLSLRLTPDGGVWQADRQGALAKPSPEACMDVVFGVGDPAGFALRLVCQDQAAVSVAVPGSAARARRELESVVQHFVQAGRLPSEWARKSVASDPTWSPTGMALEMDNHVSKRAAVCGHAGGFVCAYTNESVYPSMWSAQLAAQVFATALGSPHPQDQLREFDCMWRMSMAEYLRAPHADAKSILPMVFSNQQMADRMLEAFMHGTNF